MHITDENMFFFDYFFGGFRVWRRIRRGTWVGRLMGDPASMRWTRYRTPPVAGATGGRFYAFPRPEGAHGTPTIEEYL